MALSGNSSGGANTNLTGLTPEQISHAVNSNVAGGKLAQDSIQNIFENQQKMAYSDYLDRLPQDRVTKETADIWDHLEGKDTWLVKNRGTGEIKDTGFPLSAKKTQYGPTSGGGNYFFTGLGPDGQPIQMVAPKQGTPTAQVVTTPDKKPVPVAEAVRKQEAQEAVQDKRVAELDTIIQGLKIDKDSKDRKKFEASTQSHLNEFNEKATTPYVYVMDEVTNPTWGGFGPNKVEVKPVKRELPPGIDAAKATKAYNFYLKNGRTGTFDNFIFELQQGKIQIK